MVRAKEPEGQDRGKVLAAFKEADSNNDETITKGEFSTLLQILDPSWNDAKLDKLFNIMDVDRSGAIEIDELIEWLFPGPKGETRKKARNIQNVTGGREQKGKTDKREQKGATNKLVKEEKNGKLVVPPPRERPGKLSRPSSRQSSAASSECPSSSDSEGDRDSSSSSSSSSDDEAGRGVVSEKLRKREEHRKLKAAAIAKVVDRHEEPFTTAKEVYQVLTPHFEEIGARLKLKDLTDLFAKCKGEGLCTDLRRIIPQSCQAPSKEEDVEDVSALELGHLYCLLDEQPNATDQDAIECIRQVKDICRTFESNDIRDIGLDEDSPVTDEVLMRLLEILSAAMYIDQAHILEQMGYSQSGRFAMTQSMAETVMEKLFLKSAGPDGSSVLEKHVKSNDFMRMCFSLDLTDNTAKKGIPHAQLSLFFTSTLHSLPRIMKKRNKKRVGGNHRKRRTHQHAHRSLKGRSKLSILFQELWRAMPAGLYKCPTLMVLSLLESASAAEAAK